MPYSVEHIAELLPFLAPEERAELLGLMSTANRMWLPLPGPQLIAYESRADVIGFGGAAGGGKSDLAIGAAINKHQRSAIFRREGTQLQGIIQRLTDVLGGRDGYNGQDKIWRIPGTSKVIELGSCPNPGDETRYQGRAKDLLVIDEAANFLESQVRFLMGWVRTTDPTLHCQTIMTFNPPTSAEGRWLIEYFAPWLDPGHLVPAAPGELRWFAMVNGKDIEVSGPDVVMVDERGKKVLPQSRTFIPSKIDDNPFLINTGYVAQLQAMPEPLRSQMLYGDFQAGVMDDAFQVIPTAWVDLAMSRWQQRIVKPPMDSMGVDVARGGMDKTTIARRHGWWFDQPIAYPGSSTPDGHTVMAHVLTNRRDDAVVHIDVIGVGASPYDLLKGVAQTVGVNVANGSTETDISGQLTFANVRTQLWWKMRELLDPQANNGVALPPDEQLKRELCAPTWRPHGKVIIVESRDEIIKRIGRSPDLATAYIQCAMTTPKRGHIESLGNTGGQRRGYDPLDQMRSGNISPAQKTYDPFSSSR